MAVAHPLLHLACPYPEIKTSYDMAHLGRQIIMNMGVSVLILLGLKYFVNLESGHSNVVLSSLIRNQSGCLQ